VAICLDYQEVYHRREVRKFGIAWQMIAAGFLLLALSAKVWTKLQSTNLGYELAAQQQISLELDMQRRELELQRSVLGRSDMLAHRANQKLGLETLQPSQAVKLSYSVGVLPARKL